MSQVTRTSLLLEQTCCRISSPVERATSSRRRRRPQCPDFTRGFTIVPTLRLVWRRGRESASTPYASLRPTAQTSVPKERRASGSALPSVLFQRLLEELLLQRSHIDDETVLHVALQQAVVGFVDLLDVDHLDIAHDVVFAAEVQHLLGLGDASDQRTRKLPASHNQAERRDRQRLFGRAYQGQCAVYLQQVEVRIDVMVRRDGIEDEV